jgi:hypothetical protein
MRTALASRSLADLTARVAAKAPPSYAIDVSNWLGERSLSRRGTAQRTPRGRSDRKPAASS